MEKIHYSTACLVRECPTESSEDCDNMGVTEEARCPEQTVF